MIWERESVTPGVTPSGRLAGRIAGATLDGGVQLFAGESEVPTLRLDTHAESGSAKRINRRFISRPTPEERDRRSALRRPRPGAASPRRGGGAWRSEEHTSELQSRFGISY